MLWSITLGIEVFHTILQQGTFKLRLKVIIQGRAHKNRGKINLRLPLDVTL